MTYLLKGALLEYGSDFLGPIPNLVIFQFNPESLSRDIEIPTRPKGAESRETHQAEDITVENISLTAHFSAADHLDTNHPLARAFGIGPHTCHRNNRDYPVNGILNPIYLGLSSVLTLKSNRVQHQRRNT